MSGTATSMHLVGSGRYTDVYDLGDGRVLRRYRDERVRAEREAEVMVHARTHGVPVPEVFDVAGRDIVMEHAPGPTMLQVLVQRPWTVDQHARRLGDLHALVHTVPALDWMEAPFGDGTCLLHVDLHPENVILTEDGPRVIDWQAAARGPADADIALTWVVIATSEVPGPEAQRTVGGAGQGFFAARFVRAVPPVDRRWFVRAAEWRVRDPSVREVEVTAIRRLLESDSLPGRRTCGQR